MAALSVKYRRLLANDVVGHEQRLDRNPRRVGIADLGGLGNRRITSRRLPWQGFARREAKNQSLFQFPLVYRNGCESCFLDGAATGSLRRLINALAPLDAGRWVALRCGFEHPTATEISHLKLLSKRYRPLALGWRCSCISMACRAASKELLEPIS